MVNETFPPIPDPVKFCLETSLYACFKLNPNKIREVEFFNDPIDLFCLECQKTSIFNRETKPLGVPPTPRQGYKAPSQEERNRETLKKRIFALEFQCTRNNKHTATFIFRVGGDSICKIGQYPSKADIEYPDLKKYRKILKSDYTDLTKAVGLASHGVGIGSFVYLRRIFENLVNEAASKKHSIDLEWNRDEWEVMRMDDKIKELSEDLPEFLVENRTLYSILSKGLHELGENECLNYFDIIKAGIEEILDDKLAKKEKELRRKSLQDKIGKITGQLR